MAKAEAALKADPKKDDAGTAEIRQAMAEVLPPIRALLAQEIWAREAGVKFNTWEAVPPAGTQPENILRPDFWSNVSARMRMGDKIIVVPRDGAFYAELVVWDAGQNWANVSGGHQERPQFAARGDVSAEFEIVSDPIDGITVKRAANGAKLKGNFPNHEDARRWILEHQRAMRS
jgi:hypothetical protein